MFSGNLEDCSCVLHFHVSICLGLFLLSALSSLYKQCQNPYISPRACNSFSKTNFHPWWGHDNSTLFSSCGVQKDGSSGLTTLSSHKHPLAPNVWGPMPTLRLVSRGSSSTWSLGYRDPFPPLFPPVWIRVLQQKRACFSPLLPP